MNWLKVIIEHATYEPPMEKVAIKLISVTSPIRYYTIKLSAQRGTYIYCVPNQHDYHNNTVFARKKPRKLDWKVECNFNHLKFTNSKS